MTHLVMSRVARRATRVALVSSLWCVAAAIPAWAQEGLSGAAARAATQTAQTAFQRGDYARAKQLASQADDAPALIVRARLAELASDLDEAARFAALATQRANRPEHRREAAALHGAVLIAQGKWDQADALLREQLKADSAAHGVRARLGELLWMRGQQAEARAILEALGAAFNDGRVTRADDLVDLGRAMWLLGRFDDANYALKRAIEADADHVEGHVLWGQLLLTKYNTPDALESFEDALKLNPHHPGALAGRAMVELTTSNQSEGVLALIKKIMRVAPDHPDALLVRAHLAVRDEDCPSALEATQTLLARRPKHLEALALKATCEYLRDDAAAFEATRDATLKLSPRYAEFLVIVAEYAIRAHRYIEAMSLYRDALKIQDDHAGALLGLGVGLSRVGQEDEAQELLQRAFDVDPYNVRAYNMVELYEKAMPEYEFTLYDGFKVRAHKEQRELVNLVVAPVAAEALRVFGAKYGVKPWQDLAVEVYPHPQTFSVRSVGMPNISPHGICFGKVVTVRSPSDGNFNWRQVVWHELAHTFHLFVSKSRVPRWFTEGMAEYETNVHDPAWMRHHDLEIAIKLQKDDIPSVLDFNRGFTHARSYGEVLRSYHLASLSIHFIAQTWGYDALIKMLQAWGQSKRTPQVLQSVLGVDAQAFDAKFLAWLKHRHMHFMHQALLDPEQVQDVEALERQLKLNARNAKVWRQLALVHMGQRDGDKADLALARALEIDARDPETNLIAATLRYAQGRTREALKHGDVVLAAFKDSYSLRVLMGDSALKDEDLTGARVHLEAAVQLYPTGAQAWALLQRVGKATKDAALEQRALSMLYTLDPHDPELPRLMTRQLTEAKQLERTLEVARRWVDINPFDVKAQRALIRAGQQRRDVEAVAQGYDALILLQPSEREALYAEAIRAMVSARQPQRAKALAQRARQAQVPEAVIQAALDAKP